MAEIDLSRGLKSKVDDEDILLISKYKWHVVYKREGGKPYAETSVHISGSKKLRKKKNYMMHKIILKTNKHVDHKNGDTLDNRRENLRECNNSQNHMNISKNKGKYTSKFKGVVLKPNGKYEANISAGGKHIYLGKFLTEKEAAEAYNEAAKQIHGDFALLNEV